MAALGFSAQVRKGALCWVNAPYFSPIREWLHNINPLHVSRPECGATSHSSGPDGFAGPRSSGSLVSELHAVPAEGDHCLTCQLIRRSSETAETKSMVVVCSMAQLRSGEPPKSKGFNCT
jgi:hypothetical protein